MLNDEEYRHHLEMKLNEEVKEFHADKNVEELADILEVVYALAAAGGYSRKELLAVYQHKHDVRGGFANRIFLIGKE